MTHQQPQFINVLLILALILINVAYVYPQENDTLQEHQQLAKYPALLWEITSSESTHKSYLYGALETNQKLAFHLIDSFFTAMKISRRIILEMHPDSTAKALKDPAILKRVYKNRFNSQYRPTGNYYTLLLPSAFDADMFAWVLSGGSLQYGRDMESDMVEDKSLADFVYTTALKTKKEVAGLVSYEEYLDQTEKAEKFAVEQSKKQKNVREDYQEQYLLYQKAFDAYRKGDLGELDTLFRKMVNMPEFFTNILEPFYDTLAIRIADQLKETSCFIMMDATAMGGKNGMIEKLRKMGFELKPVTHYILTKPNKQKEKLERMTTKVKMVKYSPPAGIWEVKVPDYTLGSASENMGQSFFNDQLNDVVYSVNRIPTNASLSFQNPDYIFQRLDSVVYEYVPGKIIKRKDHMVSGFPALDILNKTSRGNLEHFRLIITPLEIIVFKISGKKGYIKKKGLGKKFIASTTLMHQGWAGWKEVSTGHGEFKVALPSYHIVDSVSNMVFVDPEIVYQAWDPNSSSYFMFRRNIHHDLNLLEEDTFDLNFMAERMAEKMKMEITKELPGSHQGYPSLHFTLKEKSGNGLLKAKIVIRGAAHYLLMTSSTDSASVTKFFDSFLITPFAYDLSRDTLIDTVLLFSVVSPISKQEQDDKKNFDFGYEEEDEEDEVEKKKRLENAHKSNLDKATFFYDLGAEYIVIERLKENDYTGFLHYKDLFNELKAKANPKNEYLIRHEIQDSTTTFPFLDITLGDTNTTRQIRNKMIIHHGLIFTLRAMSDTIEGERPFTRQFFNTFTPDPDTLTGRSLLEDKGRYWIVNFLSEDTIKVKQAINALHKVKFRDHMKDSLLLILQSKELMLRNIAVAKQLIETYGNFKGDAIPSNLHKLYATYSEHPDIQISIFRSLAFHQGEGARKVMLQILQTDIPLPSSKSEINSLVKPLLKYEDQATALYPEIMQYERYPEYAKWVYAIAASLAEKGKIDPDRHPQVVKMVRERVDEELKRRRASDIVDKASKTKAEDVFDVFYDYSDIVEIAEYDEEEIYEDFDYDFEYDSENAMDETNDAETDQEDETNIMDYSEFMLMVKLLSHSKSQQSSLPAVYENILAGRNRSDALALAILMTDQGLPVHDSIWKNFAKNPKSRIDLYRKLKSRNRTALFDTLYLNQQAFAESFLHIRRNITEKDSLTFVARRWVQTPRKGGYLYFYQYKSGYGNNTDWYLNVVGIQPADTAMVSEKPDFVEFNTTQLYFNDDLDKIINEQMKEYRKLHRKRFGNDYDDFSYEEYMIDYDY